MLNTRTKFEITGRPIDVKHLKERLIGRFCIDSLSIKAYGFSPSLSLEIRVSLFLKVQGDLYSPA